MSSPEDSAAALNVLPDLLTLSVGDAVILADIGCEPMSPRGWSERVSEIGDRVMIALIPRELRSMRMVSRCHSTASSILQRRLPRSSPSFTNKLPAR